ncbi:MAG: hypothetical protein LBC41_12770 [Clostridiales bacterium]|jgi:hypothetical protein|nr:hypothetical protein [Clostridiales bacterium]
MATELTGENMIKSLADAEFRFEKSLGESGAVSVSLQVDSFSGQRCCMLSCSVDSCNTGQIREYIQGAVRDQQALPYRVAASVDGEKIGFLFIAEPDLIPLSDYRAKHAGKNWLKNAPSACMQVSGILEASPGATLSASQLFVRESDSRIFWLPWPRFLEAPGIFADWKGTNYASVDTAKRDGRTVAAFLLYWLKGLSPGGFGDYTEGSPYHDLIAHAFLYTVRREQIKDKLLDDRKKRTMKPGWTDSLQERLEGLKSGVKKISRKASAISEDEEDYESDVKTDDLAPTPPGKPERRGTVDVDS